MIWFDGKKFYQAVVNFISADKPTREELEALRCILNENVDKIVQLMPLPRRNPDDRALVISANAEGGADLHGDDEKIELSTTVINEALIISDTFDLNEIAAVDLLYLGERENFKQYGFTRGLCAVYLFFKRSWYFAEALRAIALNIKGRRWACDRPLAMTVLLSEYMAQLLSSGLLYNTLRYITEFDLKGLLSILEHPDVRGIGDSRHRRMISDVIFDTVLALCDVIFYSACQLAPTYNSVEKTLCFLCEIDLKNEQSPEKCSILLSIVFSGLELIDQSEFCDISASRSHLIDWDVVTQVYDCMLVAQRFIRDAQWVDTGLKGVFMLALASGIRILRRSPSCISIDERRDRLADEEALFMESLKHKPFHYMRQKLLCDDIYRDEFLQRRFHVYLIQLLVLFRTKFKDLRLQCENVSLNQTTEAKDSLHFIQLVLLIKEFYQYDPFDLHLGNAYFDFTPTPCMSPDSEAMESKNELVRFVRGSAEFLPPILYSDFMDMLNSLATSEEAALACFNLLMDFSSQGEQLKTCSLGHMFLALQQYSISLEQAIAASGLTEVPISTEIDPIELQCLKRCLYLIAALAERNPLPRSMIFNSKDWNCSTTLINLLGYPLPVDFKQAILAVLDALTKTEEFALSICSAAVESGLFHSTNGRHSPFLIELLKEDSERGPFLLSTALMHLIRTSVRHRAFIEEIDPTYTIYLSLLMHRIIPKIMTITVKCTSEKVELFNLLIETLYDWMVNLGNSLENIRSRALATEVLTSVLTGGRLYNWIHDIVEMGFTELDKYEEHHHIKNRPLLKLLTNVLKFCYDIAVKNRQILHDRYEAQSIPVEMETVNMLMISGQYKLCENRFICMLIKFFSYCPFHPMLSLLAIKILREINFAEFPQWSVLAALASEQDVSKVIYSFVACLDIDGVDINQVDSNAKLESLFKKTDAQIRGMVALEMLEFLNDNITFVSRMDPRSGINTTTIPNSSSIALFVAGFDIRNPETTVLEEMGVQGTRKTVLHAALEILASGLDKNKDAVSFGALLEPAYRFCYLLCEVRSSREVFLRFVRSTQDFVFRHFSHFVQFFTSEEGKACSLRMYNCMCYVMKMVSFELEQILTVEGINDMQRYFEYFFNGDTKWDSVLFSLISNRPLLEEPLQWTPPELENIEINRVLPLLNTCTSEIPTGYRLCYLPTLMTTLEREVHLYMKANLYPSVDFTKDFQKIINAVKEYNQIQLRSFIRKEYFTAWQSILERLIIVQQRFDSTFKMPINCILQILEALLTQDFVNLTGKVSKAVFILGAWFRRLKAVQRWTTAEFMDKAIAGSLTEEEVTELPTDMIEYSNSETEPHLLRSLTYIMHLLIRRIECNEVRQSEESQLYYYSMFLLFLHMLPFLSVKNTFPMSHFIPDKVLGRTKLAQSEELSIPDPQQYAHSWEIRMASVEALLQFPSAVLQFYADSFSQLLLNDCCDGPTENKMIALSCVTSTISMVYNLRMNLCEASILGGYVRHHVDALLDEDNAPLNGVLSNAKANGSPHALHIARLAFLTTIAADKNGALHLIQLNTFEKLAEMNSYELLFPNLDSDEVDGSGITLGRRCRTVMMAVLQMCSTVLDHFEDGHLVCQQAMLTFLSKHVTMFSWLIDAHNGVVLASLEDLRLLKRLVAVLTPCTRLELLQAAVDNERTAVAKSLSQLLGRLLSCFTEYMTNFENNHDCVDYDTLIVFEDFELHILQIAEELIDFCILHIGVGGYKRKKYSPFLCLPAIPQDCEEIALSVLLIQMLQQCVVYWKTHCAKTPLEKGIDLNNFSFGTNLDEIVKRTQLYKEVSYNIHGREMLGNIRSQQLVTLQTLFEKTLFALRCHILSTIYRYADSAQPVNVERGGVVDNGDAASNAEAELLALKSFRSTLRNDLTAALFDNLVQLADFFVASEQSIPAWDIFSKQKFSHGAIQEIRDLVWNFH